MSKIKIKKPQKAVIFARVSTQEQFNEGCSIDAQIKLMEDYCKKNDLEIIKKFEVVETSTRGNREKFHECLEFIRNQNEKIALVSDKVDRLQRSILDIPKLDKLVNEGKASLDFLDIGRLDDESNAQQKAFYRMAVVFANAYTDSISDNVKRSNHNKRSNGTIKGDSPIGYINEVRNKATHPDPIVVVDPQRAPFVVKAFEMYATDCYSVGEIAKILNQEGLTQKRGKQKGKPVNANLIDRMLTTRFYYGEDESYKYNLIYKHVYPPLITKELFDKCQKIRQSRGRGLGKVREEEKEEQEQIMVHKCTQKPFLYKAMIKCLSCNCTYSPELKTKKVIKEKYKNTPSKQLKEDHYEIKEYTYLRPVKKGKNNCPDCKHVNEDCINTQIEKIIDTIHIDKELIEVIKPDLQKELDKNTDYKVNRVSLIDEKLLDLQRRKQNLFDMRTGGEITKEEFISKNNIFETQISQLNKEKEQLTENSKLHKEAVIDIFKIASNIKDIYKSSDINRKREILKIICPNLKLQGLNLHVSLRKPFNLLLPKEVNTEWLRG